MAMDKSVEVLFPQADYEALRRLSPRDAIHAGVVFTCRLEGIVNPDRGFDRVAGLHRFDPLDLAAG